MSTIKIYTAIIVHGLLDRRLSVTGEYHLLQDGLIFHFITVTLIQLMTWHINSQNYFELHCW